MIDYQAIAKAGGISKGDPRKKVKARKARADAKGLKAFRDAVFDRERDIFGCAHCARCGRIVWQHNEPHGEVHHVIGRRNKATRYDPSNGMLLCGGPNGCHRKVQEHR